MDLNPNTIQARSAHMLKSFEKGERQNHKYIRKEGNKYIYKEPEEHENKQDYESMHIAFSNMEEFFKNDKQATEALGFLKPLVKANKNIRIDTKMEFDNPRVLGLSYPDGRIGINKNSVYAKDKEMVYRTLMHEMVHAVTREKMKTNETLQDEFNDVLSEVRKHFGLADNEALIKHLYANGQISEDQYGAADQYELVAEVFTNKKFMELLKSIPYKKDNLLKKVMMAVFAAFSETSRKVKKAKKDLKNVDNMADYLVGLTEKVFTPPKKMNKEVEKAFQSIMCNV